MPAETPSPAAPRGARRWLPLLGAPLAAGPATTFLAAFLLSPGIPAAVALLGERRVLRPRQEFRALVYGDPLLALAAAAGVAQCRSVPPTAVRSWVRGPLAVAASAGWLGFGLWQWRAEVRSGRFNRAQALAPTKIYHQLGVYPLLGYLAGSAVLAGLTCPQPRHGRAGQALIAACVGSWAAANVVDRRHLKLGHPPYDWHRLRPADRPWPLESETLRCAATG
ncbi:hypothetical protein C7C46_31590 [Streptomyces tateyamensis]|uniref:Uncharacterized protein n=2 Tax=Streptomyces tateyamensis TaxID=565073 RepID=A0A2V4NXH5_9ACTN|nr:hypothetical protein C7C46_31590 [Streptomyces tateyamensis]